MGATNIPGNRFRELPESSQQVLSDQLVGVVEAVEKAEAEAVCVTPGEQGLRRHMIFISRRHVFYLAAK